MTGVFICREFQRGERVMSQEISLVRSFREVRELCNRRFHLLGVFERFEGEKRGILLGNDSCQYIKQN